MGHRSITLQAQGFGPSTTSHAHVRRRPFTSPETLQWLWFAALGALLIITTISTAVYPLSTHMKAHRPHVSACSNCLFEVDFWSVTAFQAHLQRLLSLDLSDNDACCGPGAEGMNPLVRTEMKRAACGWQEPTCLKRCERRIEFLSSHRG